jgi:hypothetical protein
MGEGGACAGHAPAARRAPRGGKRMARDGGGPGGLGGGVGQRLEAMLARRILRHAEPLLEGWVRAFLRSEAGQALLAEVVADVAGDLFDPEGPAEGGLAERVLLALVARYVRRSAFRERVHALLRAAEGVEGEGRGGAPP